METILNTAFGIGDGNSALARPNGYKSRFYAKQVGLPLLEKSRRNEEHCIAVSLKVFSSFVINGSSEWADVLLLMAKRVKKLHRPGLSASKSLALGSECSKAWRGEAWIFLTCSGKGSGRRPFYPASSVVSSNFSN